MHAPQTERVGTQQPSLAHAVPAGAHIPAVFAGAAELAVSACAAELRTTVTATEFPSTVSRKFAEQVTTSVAVAEVSTSTTERAFTDPPGRTSGLNVSSRGRENARQLLLTGNASLAGDTCREYRWTERERKEKNGKHEGVTCAQETISRQPPS